jgi:hypothetical protein
MIRSCLPYVPAAVAAIPTLLFGGKALSDFSQPAHNAGGKAGDVAQGTAWTVLALGAGTVGAGMTYGALKASKALSGDKSKKTGEPENKSTRERVKALFEKFSPSSEQGSAEENFVKAETASVQHHPGPDIHEDSNLHIKLNLK